MVLGVLASLIAHVLWHKLVVLSILDHLKVIKYASLHLCSGLVRTLCEFEREIDCTHFTGDGINVYYPLFSTVINMYFTCCG